MSISGKVDPVVRPVAATDIAEALVEGLRDFQALPLYGLGFGAGIGYAFWIFQKSPILPAAPVSQVG